MHAIRPIVVAVGLALAAAGATAQTASASQVKVEIKSQILRDALNDWAQQTGFQLISPSTGIKNEFVAPAVNGTLSPREALELLLSGTSLTYEFLDERTVVVRERRNPSIVTTAWLTGDETNSNYLAAEGEKGVQRIQVAQLETQSGSAQRQAANPDSDSRDAHGASIEEIVVTAQKRAERLQDVPISISVLGGPDLDRSTVEGVTEALGQVPGVVTMPVNQGGGMQLGIRGVGASGPTLNGSNPIAYYVDSVPFGFVKQAIVPDASAYDMERVEVLRGPQGTLYGANAQNGVVRVLTANPDLNEFEAKVRTSYSSTTDGGDNYRGDMAVNVPLIQDKLAVRAVAGYQDLSGWIDGPVRKDINDAEMTNFRLKVGAQPTDKLAITLSGWGARDDYGAPSVSDDDRRVSATDPQPRSTNFDAYGLKIDYELSAATISSMTSYLEFETGGGSDLTPYGLPGYLGYTALDSRVASQEIILASNGRGAWTWSAGVFYRNGEDRLFQDVVGLLPVPVDYSDGSESYAAFGEIRRRFADGRLELTLGARYFHDDVFHQENVQQQGLPSVPLLHLTDTYDATTPRAVLTWYPNSDFTFYASYSQGFRSGSPQNAGIVQAAPNTPPVEPDKLHNYEVGAKATLLEGRVSIDSAVYYIDWKDVQQSVAIPLNGFPFIVMVNGESASGIGADFAVMTRFVEGLELGFSVSWNDLALDSPVRGFEAGGPPEGVIVMNKGDRLNYSSEYTANALAEYSFPLGRGGLNGQIAASANYVSEQTSRGISGVLFSETGDDLMTAHASVSINTDRWAAMVYVDNLNDENGAVPPTVPIDEWSPRGRPRTIGLQVDFKF